MSVPHIRITLATGSDLYMPLVNRDAEQAYKEARMRLAHALNSLANSDDVKLIEKHDGLKRYVIDGDVTQFGLIYGFRDSSSHVDAVACTPPGFITISYDRNNMQQFQ